MANKILRGNDLMIFKDTTGAGTAYKALAFSTSCQLSLTGNTLETSSKDGGKWTSKAVSKLSWSLTTDNLYSVEDFNALVNSWISREESWCRRRCASSLVWIRMWCLRVI